MTDATDRLGPNAITWQCPYCQAATSDSEQGIRAHINNLDDGTHEGLSGWDLDHHVPGYNRDGHLVAAIRAGADHFEGRAISPAAAIRDTDWHHEFVHPQEAVPEEVTPEEATTEETPTDEPASPASSDPSPPTTDEDSPPPDEIEISLTALNEIQTVLAHYREAGKREERLAEPGSIPAARAQARWYMAGRFIELFDTLRENADERPAQAGHDRQL